MKLDPALLPKVVSFPFNYPIQTFDVSHTNMWVSNAVTNYASAAGLE